ncbi:MAG: hypothetical protein V4714_06155 [Bacteroidota bacterium]
MNQIFSFRRFWLLLKLDFAENGKSYLLSSGIIIGLMLLLMAPIMFKKDHQELLSSLLHPMAFFICVIFGGSLFTSTAFVQYNTPTRGISALMVPASQSEKFLATLLINMAFMVLFIVLFWQLHHRLIDIANSRLPANSWKYHPIPPDITTYFTFSYFLIQGAMFLGSIYFSRNTYIKALATCVVIVLVVSVFNYILAYQFTSHPSHLATFPFTSWNGFQDKHFIVAYPEPVWKWIWAFVMLIIVGLWSASYLRLKEKEI